MCDLAGGEEALAGSFVEVVLAAGDRGAEVLKFAACDHEVGDVFGVGDEAEGVCAGGQGFVVLRGRFDFFLAAVGEDDGGDQ